MPRHVLPLHVSHLVSENEADCSFSLLGGERENVGIKNDEIAAEKARRKCVQDSAGLEDENVGRLVHPEAARVAISHRHQFRKLLARYLDPVATDVADEEASHYEGRDDEADYVDNEPGAIRNRQQELDQPKVDQEREYDRNAEIDLFLWIDERFDYDRARRLQVRLHGKPLWWAGKFRANVGAEYVSNHEGRSMGSNAEVIREVDPAPAKAGIWEDFVDIFYAPSSVFARRSDGKFGMALFILLAVGTVLVFLTKNAVQPIMDAEFTRRSADMLAKNPNLTAEQLASGRGVMETFGPIFFTVGIALTVLGTGIVLWLVGKLFDAKESVAAAMMIATYSEVPRIVQILTNAAQGLFMSPEKLNSMNSVGFNLARFLDPDHASAVAIALASRVDLFTIWVTVLLAIGLHVVGRISKQQAGIAAAITWVVGALPGLFGALRG
jgi:Yip1 domain